MSQFVFITDLHLTSSSRVRTGDVVEDLAAKLQFVADYCNHNACALLIGGDLFDKPSVPDFVKSRIAPILMSIEKGVYSIPGNHDLLYSNSEFTYKTSYFVWVSHKVITDVYEDIDFGDVVLSSQLPLTDKGKPQIVLRHGFLNKEDGPWTVMFDQLITSDPTYVLLGHDHVVYDPVSITEKVKVFRPGSFLRGIRNDESNRQPCLLHIRVRDGKLQNKLVPIPCRDAYEIFRTKEQSVSKSEQHHTYDVIIDQIRNAQKSDLTFEDAISKVATPDVSEFIRGAVFQAKQDNSIKSKNL